MLKALFAAAALCIVGFATSPASAHDADQVRYELHQRGYYNIRFLVPEPPFQVPIMWSTGTGSEVMQRIAVPMIGGMVSSTLLTLVVIPAIYGLVKGWNLSHGSVRARDQVVVK